MVFRVQTVVVLAVIGVVVLSGGCTFSGSQPNPDGKMARIADPKTNDHDISKLANEVRGTKPSRPEAVVWAQIANSDQFSPARRRLAVFQLFDRNAALGMTVRDLAAVLAKPCWLTRDHVIEVTALGGAIGIDIVPGESVFVVLPNLPENDRSAVYLRVEDSPFADELYRALQGNRSAAASLKVTAISVFAADNEDESLIGAPRDVYARPPRP